MLVALACSGLLAACSSKSATSTSGASSASTQPPGAALVTPTGRPATYQVLYQSENLAAQPPQERWDQLTVSRPFLAKSVSFASRPTADTPPVNGTLTSTDALFRIGPQGLVEVSSRQPAVGTDDQALGPVLRDAVARGLAAPLTTARTIAGRPCHDVRFAEPVAGPLKRLSAVDGHDDLCIDDDGLVLREEWTLKGRVVLRRTAVAVDTAPSGLDGALSTAGASPRDPSVAAPTATSLTQGPDPWFAAPAPPEGFTPATQVGLVFPDPQTPGGIAYTSEVWAFTRGADLITVEAGNGGTPWVVDDPTEKSTIGGAGGTPALDATSVIRSDGVEIRALVPGDRARWIRVRGTMPVTDVEAYARTLHTPSG